MSITTYYMHLIFSNLPNLASADFIIYVLTSLSVLILIFSLKIMFYQAPKLRKVK